MKKTGILMKASFVAIAALAFNSAAYSQGAEVQPGKQNGGTSVQSPSNKLRGNTVTAAESKLIISSQTVTKAVTSSSPQKNCSSKSTMKPYSISRSDFNNLPADRQQFLLSNSDKYTIVD